MNDHFLYVKDIGEGLAVGETSKLILLLLFPFSPTGCLQEWKRKKKMLAFVV